MTSSSRNRARRARVVVAAAYTLGIGVLPALHAAAEVAWSRASVEASHTERCPTLHAGAVCAAAAGLALGHVGRSPTAHVRATLTREPTLPPGRRLRSTSPPRVHPARAPPRG